MLKGMWMSRHLGRTLGIRCFWRVRVALRSNADASESRYPRLWLPIAKAFAVFDLITNPTNVHVGRKPDQGCLTKGASVVKQISDASIVWRRVQAGLA